jgi:hypothetical protein
LWLNLLNMIQFNPFSCKWHNFIFYNWAILHCALHGLLRLRCILQLLVRIFGRCLLNVWYIVSFNTKIS